jgi:hypothetical protein
MSKEIDVEQASDWSKEEAEFNISYLEARNRFAEANRVRELRGGGGGEGDEGSYEWLEDATAEQVVDWVGDDPARAQQALDWENNNKQRVKLTEKLESILA